MQWVRLGWLKKNRPVSISEPQLMNGDYFDNRKCGCFAASIIVRRQVYFKKNKNNSANGKQKIPAIMVDVSCATDAGIGTGVFTVYVHCQTEGLQVVIRSQCLLLHLLLFTTTTTTTTSIFLSGHKVVTSQVAKSSSSSSSSYSFTDKLAKRNFINFTETEDCHCIHLYFIDRDNLSGQVIAVDK